MHQIKESNFNRKKKKIVTTVKNSKLLDKIVILAFKIYFKKCSNYMKLMKLKFCFVLFVFVLCLWSNVSCFSGLSSLD